MEHEVLIGTVKNKAQLEVNLNEKFYHIPEAVVPKNLLPVDYVALYLSAKSFGEGEILYYGKVSGINLVKRGEITSIPARNPEMMYYKFDIEEWKKLPKPIVRENGGIYTKAFTSLEKLLSAEKLADIVNTGKTTPRKYGKSNFKDVEITKDPVGAKLLAKRINKAYGKEKVAPVQITKFLLINGYLKIEHDEKSDTEIRVPTEKGAALGIENFWELNRFYREYNKNYYSEEAQRFVVEHINSIAQIPLADAYSNN